MKASKEVNGIEIINAPKNEDFFATSETVTMINAVISVFIK